MSPPTNRLNDGKVGPDGAFWVGSMDENSPRQKIAALYRVTADGRITKEQDGYAVSNGLAWSPDGRIMYHSDSTAGIIEAWDFDPATGARGQASHSGDADERGRSPRRRGDRHRRQLLVGRAVRRLHQLLQPDWRTAA